MSPSSTIRTFSDLDALSRAAARDLTADIRETLRTEDRYTLALAGGGTPQRLYELLAEGTEGTVPWSQVHLFWGDERFVPHHHSRSNVRLVRDALLTEIDIPDANVHPMPTQGTSPEADAAAYTETLKRHFEDRDMTFDTVLLGLGSDGHTASIFPETLGDEADDDRWVRAVTAPPRHEISTRLTCTLSVLNGARRACFLVAGEGKREALHGVLGRNDSALPATHVRPRGDCHWYVDRTARPTDVDDH